jgi:hypothetical protein
MLSYLDAGNIAYAGAVVLTIAALLCSSLRGGVAALIITILVMWWVSRHWMRGRGAGLAISVFVVAVVLGATTTMGASRVLDRLAWEGFQRRRWRSTKAPSQRSDSTHGLALVLEPSRGCSPNKRLKSLARENLRMRTMITLGCSVLRP